MDNTQQQEYQQAFLRLQQTYIRRLDNTVRIIDNIFELEKISPLMQEDLVRVQSLVHGLAGSGATFGYPEISAVGSEADNFLTAMLKYQIHTPTDYQRLNAMLKDIQRTCRETVQTAQKTLSPSEKISANTTATNKHVLIVDDDGDVAAVIAHGLERSGMNVKICTSGEEALHYLPRIQPDLVILDVALTGINGLEVLKQIKQNPEFIDIPVVIICTRHNAEMEFIAKRAGAQAFIAKPLDIELFTSQIIKISETANLRSPVSF